MRLVWAIIPLVLFSIIGIQESFAEKSADELNKEKLQKEIILLDEQISSKKNFLQSNFFIQILAIVSVISGVSLAGFWAWIKEKNTPPLAEHEKLFNDIVKEWHSRSHLEAYNVLWKDLEQNTDALEKHWNALSPKEFPLRTYLKDERINEINKSMKSYLKKKLKIKEDAILDEKIKSIENISYHRRNKRKLGKCS